MANKKIGALTLATVAAPEDWMEGEAAIGGDSYRISKLDWMGGFFTGKGGVITNNFALTLPASGIAALRNVAGSFTALQNFAAGLTLGAGGLTIDVAQYLPWDVIVSASTTPPTTISYSDNKGHAFRFGNSAAGLSFIWYYFRVNIGTLTLGPAAGNAQFSLPATVYNAPLGGKDVAGSVIMSGVDVPSTPYSAAFTAAGGTSLGIIYLMNDNAAVATVPITALAAGDIIMAQGMYRN